MSEVINLNNTVPAAPSGNTNVLWQKGPQSGVDPSSGAPVFPVSAYSLSPTVIGFVINTGVTGTDVGAMLVSPRSGFFTQCVVVVKASDGGTALTFTIKQNGTSVFTTSPTIAAGTASTTVVSFSGLNTNPLSFSQNDVFTIDITSGSAAWLFTAQLE